MIHPDHRHPGRIAMAILTDIGGLYMRGMLTGRGGAIVTTGTVIRHIGMVKVCRYPSICRMTLTAIFHCWDMVGVLSGGDGSIVATTTATDHVGMVHPNDWYP